MAAIDKSTPTVVSGWKNGFLPAAAGLDGEVDMAV
jgi:hypothetical protein